MTNPYLISDSTTRSLVDSLLSTRAKEDGRRYSLHIVGPDSPSRFLALKVTGDVFGERFGDTPEQLTEGYAQYFSSMLHVIAIDEQVGQPAGSLSFICGQASELMTVRDIARPDLPWGQSLPRTLAELDLSKDDICWDVATIAVPTRYAATPVMRSLLHGMYMTSLGHGVTRWTAVLDDRILAGLQRMVGGIFYPIGGQRSVNYFGSDASTAIAARVPSTLDIASGKVKPAAVVTNGFALEARVAFSNEIEVIRSEVVPQMRPTAHPGPLDLTDSRNSLTKVH